MLRISGQGYHSDFLIGFDNLVSLSSLPFGFLREQGPDAGLHRGIEKGWAL